MKGLFQLPTFSSFLCLLVICLSCGVHAEEIFSSKNATQNKQSRDMRFVPPYSNFCRSLIAEKSMLLKYQSWKVAQIPVICLPYLLEVKKTGVQLQIPVDCGCETEFEDTDFKDLYGVPNDPGLYQGSMKTCLAKVCLPRAMTGSCVCNLKELAVDSTGALIPVLRGGCSCNFHCFSSDANLNGPADKCFVDVSLKNFVTPDDKTIPPKTKLMDKDIQCECKDEMNKTNRLQYVCNCEKKM